MLTVAPGKPTGANGANDVLIATVAVKSATIVICAPTGWTAIGVLNSAGTGASRVVQEAFWAPSSVASTAFALRTTTGCSTNATVTSVSAIVAHYGGLDTTSQPDATSTTTNTAGNSSALTSPSVSGTETVHGDEVVHLYGTADTSISAGGDVRLGIGGFSDTGIPAWGAANNETGVASTANGNWIGETVALQPARPANVQITAVPTGAATGDLLIVTVAARGLGAGASICAPNGNWIPVPYNGNTTGNITSGTSGLSVTEETFYKFYNSPTTDTLPFTFTFKTSAGSCGGATAFATAVIQRYSGVSTTNPIDPPTAANITAPTTGNGTALTAPSVTTTAAGDRGHSPWRRAAPPSPEPRTRLPTATSRAAASATRQSSRPRQPVPPRRTAAQPRTTGSGARSPFSPRSARPHRERESHGLAKRDRDRRLPSRDRCRRGLGAGGAICAPNAGWTSVAYNGNTTGNVTSGTTAASVTEQSFYKFYKGRRHTAADVHLQDQRRKLRRGQRIRIRCRPSAIRAFRRPAR